MFQSQKINNDPEPYAGWSGRRYNEETRTFASLEDGPVGVEPRPEYDNNPNPILEYFRDAMSSGEYDVVALATLWESLIDTGYNWGDDGLLPELEQIEHARKVLTRLVNIFGMEN